MQFFLALILFVIAAGIVDGGVPWPRPTRGKP